MNVKRINTYQDPRFSQTVLRQHGAFVIEDEPYEIEIVSQFEAVVRGSKKAVYPRLIEEFRFYAPHITRFLRESGDVLAEFPPVNVFTLSLEDIQPSQFYVDQDKIAAVGTFLNRAEDIIVQVTPWDGRWISLDGHSRMYYAVMQGWTHIRAVKEDAFDCLYEFAEEAKKRRITRPKDMKLVSHREYEKNWNQFCDDFFAEKEENKNGN